MIEFVLSLPLLTLILALVFFFGLSHQRKFYVSAAVRHAADRTASNAEVPVVDQDRQLLRLPTDYSSADYTMRTRVISRDVTEYWIGLVYQTDSVSGMLAEDILAGDWEAHRADRSVRLNINLAPGGDMGRGLDQEMSVVSSASGGDYRRGAGIASAVTENELRSLDVVLFSMQNSSGELVPAIRSLYRSEW